MASPLRSFQSPTNHQHVGAIIRRHSTNQADVRQVALAGLDLLQARQVVDLGCGFGFMTEALAPRLAAEAELVGVDVWPSNERPFLERAAACGRGATFRCADVHDVLPDYRRTVDLLVCSYSLYFFVDALPAIAAALDPQGLFLAITHSERSCASVLEAAGLPVDNAPLVRQIQAFSAENGAELLGQWFERVERVDYPNMLRFENGQLEALLAVLRFKLPFLLADPLAEEPSDELPATVTDHADATLRRAGAVIVHKDDAIFRCWRPR